MISNDERASVTWKNIKTRRGKDGAARALGYLALLVMFGILASIFGYIMRGGATHITIQMLTTVGNGSTGGLLNAIVGTWLLVGVGLVFSLPPGILGALYFVQRKSMTRMASIMRMFTDVLTSVPSIVIGLFGYLVLVIRFNMGFSLTAGGMALGVMMLPYILRVSELSMKDVSKEQVANAYALGADDIQVATRIYIPQAIAGVLSGILLAISIAAGETAQLLYTASWNNSFTSGFLHSRVAYLTYVVWYGIDQPGQSAHNLAFVAALILILTVTALIVISKYVNYKRR
ncbi:MAG TPA: ABC transporter permease subunit [Thermoplasmataceae archaeon]|nr:ABC transporter permease subunit [Thermoplasmataceae archaeon]